MKIVIDLPEDLRKSIFDDGVFHISDGYRLAGCVMQGKIVKESEEDDDTIEPDEFADEFTEALDKFNDAIDAIQKSKCKWIKYDGRTICPKNHDIDNPYWRIPESRMDALKYCPYCGKEIEVEE